MAVRPGGTEWLAGAHLTVDLRATDDGTGRFGVRVLRARTGGKLGRVRELGPLLHAAARSDQSGRATLEIDYDSTGRVRKVEVVDAAMLRRGGLEAGMDRELRKALTESVRRWAFEPEFADGQPLPGHGSVPVSFCIERGCDRMKELAGDTRDAPFASVGPAVALRTDVADTAL